MQAQIRNDGIFIPKSLFENFDDIQIIEKPNVIIIKSLVNATESPKDQIDKGQIEERTKKAIEASNRIHEMVKERIATRHPKSDISNSDEARHKFNQITEKVRKSMHWETLDEMENAMRGENFGLVRY